MDNAAAFRLAASIVDSEPVISTYAACEWSELSEDGQLWVAEIVRQTVRAMWRNNTADGSLAYRHSWPRPATECALVPLWAGEFHSHQNWVNFATQRLTGTTGTHGVEAAAICVDAKGRRCLCGADMARARDEDAFPVRYFFECVPLQPTAPA